MNKLELDNRLIDFAVRCIAVTEALPINFAGKHLGGQLVRSATSPALNYGEAQSAESRSDFVHKMQICLKELRETLINLKIIQRCKFLPDTRLISLVEENNELISIFVKSVETAKNKIVAPKKA